MYFNNEVTYYDLDIAIEQLDVAIEGATSESIKIFNSEEMKEAKSNLLKGRSLFNDGKYDEAKKYFTKAKENFGKLRKEVNDLKAYPLSSIVSGFVKPFVNIINLFDFSKDPALDKKLRSTLMGTSAVGAFSYLMSLLPPTAIIGSAISATSAWATFIYNKIKGTKTTGEKGGFFNSVQRDILFILQVYIDGCDELISECESKK